MFNSFAAPKQKEKKENGDALERNSQYTLKTLVHDTDLRQIRPVIVIEGIHSFPRCAPLNFFYTDLSYNCDHIHVCIWTRASFRATRNYSNSYGYRKKINRSC